MAGIYIHIPFCSKACHYCDFHFSTNLTLKDQMLDAIAIELKTRKEYLGTNTVSTIYFGGGTPSLLSGHEISSLLDLIAGEFNAAGSPEITLEANPDDLSAEKLRELRSAGINRLSIGIQSFFPEDLVFMNRSHDVSQSYQCVRDACMAGFNNISVDLIFALPGKDIHWLDKNIDEVISLNVEHVSCYGLTVESKTVLADQVKKGKVIPAGDSAFAEQYKLLMKKLASAGFVQYEISNFAKPGFESKHNSSYWKGEPYLGAGPSAHSFNGDSRRWNIRNNHSYVKLVNAGEPYYEEEILSAEDRINEYILTSLRTATGVDLTKLRSIAGDHLQAILKEAEHHLSEGNVVISENRLILTEKGKLLCDHITSDLFVTNVRPDNTQV